MSYTHPGLHRIGPSNSDVPTLWSYKSADTAATVNTSGYFNDAAADLKVGDIILAFLDTGGTPQAYLFAVVSNSGTVVDVHDGLAFGTGDAD